MVDERFVGARLVCSPNTASSVLAGRKKYPWSCFLQTTQNHPLAMQEYNIHCQYQNYGANLKVSAVVCWPCLKSKLRKSFGWGGGGQAWLAPAVAGQSPFFGRDSVLRAGACG
jgi:hypothetical protein